MAVYQWIARKWQQEPVLFIDFLKTVVLLAASFGLELTTQQEASLFGALLAFSYLTRSRVRPMEPGEVR
jgi:hypothetical protein